MQEHSLNGLNYQVHSGKIEAVGNELTFGNGSLISMVRFTDGSFIRNLAADGSVGPYIRPGQTLRLGYVKARKNNVLVAADVEGYGFRAADPETMKKGDASAKLSVWVFGAMSLFTVLGASSGGLVTPFGIAMLLIGSPFYFFVAIGMKSLKWSASMESLINLLEQQCSVVLDQQSSKPELPTGSLSQA